MKTTLVCLVCLVCLVGIGACAGDDTGDDGAVIEGGTIAVASLPPVATTVAPAATSPASSTTTAPASPITTAAPTTSSPPTGATATTVTTARATTTTSMPGSAAPPCQLALIVEQTQTAYEGITPSDLNCADDWAAWIGRPEDELGDGFFAVARWTGASWELMNLGTAGVCADAGVPGELWTELGCFE